MAGEWHTVELGSLASSQNGSIAIGPFGSAMKADVYVPDGVPVIRGTNISSKRELSGEWVFIPEAFANSMQRCIVTAGDIVFPHRGSIGAVALVPDDGKKYFLSTSLMKLTVDSHKADSRYLFYYFRSLLGHSEIMRFASQVGTPGIGQPLASLRQFKVICPPARIQSQIADILWLIDDKVELNSRMAETLDSMLQAVFRSWIINFDPVRAKAGNRPTGLSDELSALFPNSLNAEGLPRGWERKSLPTLAKFLNGLALQKYPAAETEPSLPAIKIAELRTGPTPRTGRTSQSVPKEFHVQNGDHLFSWSGSLTHCRWTYGPGALNQHLFKVTPLDHYPDWLIYQSVEYHLPEFQAIAAGKAVTMGHIQRRHLEEATIAVPPAHLLEVMDRLIKPIFRRKLAVDLQTRTLTELRDLLLPKLISGELRIADAKRMIAAA